MGAMMTRYDGHPYENDDVLPFEAADPTKSLAELMEDMDEYELPPEMHPEAFPELLLAEGPGGIKVRDRVPLLSRGICSWFCMGDACGLDSKPPQGAVRSFVCLHT